MVSDSNDDELLWNSSHPCVDNSHCEALGAAEGEMEIAENFFSFWEKRKKETDFVKAPM